MRKCLALELIEPGLSRPELPVKADSRRESNWEEGRAIVTEAELATFFLSRSGSGSRFLFQTAGLRSYNYPHFRQT